MITGRFRKLLEPLYEICGLSSICIAVGLVCFNYQGHVWGRTTEGCDPKNDTADMIVGDERSTLWE